MKSDMLKFYSYIQEETVYDSIEIGKLIEAFDFFGKRNLKVTRIEGNTAYAEDKGVMIHLEKRGSQWVWNHCMLDKKAIAKITLV